MDHDSQKDRNVPNMIGSHGQGVQTVSTHLDSTAHLARDCFFAEASAATLRQPTQLEELNHETHEYTLPDIEALLASIPQHAPATSFGPDIDAVNRALLDPDLSIHEKQQHLRKWVSSRFQPCIFGRLGAKNQQGISFDVCWIDRATLLGGSAHVISVLQEARRQWKQRARQGVTHGLLIMFNAPAP